MAAFFVVFLCLLGHIWAQCPTGSTSNPAVNGACPTGTTLTSGVCCSAAAACVDKVNPSTGRSDCPSRANLCNNSAYFNLMTQECPRTCGRCSTCADQINPSTGKSDCPSLANLCNRSDYRTLMTQQCPKTCGFCS